MIAFILSLAAGILVAGLNAFYLYQTIRKEEEPVEHAKQFTARMFIGTVVRVGIAFAGGSLVYRYHGSLAGYFIGFLLGQAILFWFYKKIQK